MNKPRLPTAIRDTAGFDFDAWSALFERDPEAFERQRRQLLQAELAKGSNVQREHLAAVLDAYDERVRDLPAAERMQVASEFAIGSLRRLQDELVGLNAAASATLPGAEPRTATGFDTAGATGDTEPSTIRNRKRACKASQLH